jgi:hypothetical protein
MPRRAFRRARDERRRLLGEPDDLHLRAGCDFRREMLHGVHGLLPFRRRALCFRRQVAAPQDVDERAVEHARGGVDEDHDALAAESHARQRIARQRARALRE